MSKWIKVEDQLPEERVRVLTTLKISSSLKIAYMVVLHDNILWFDEYRNVYGVLAWQPLPEPFKE